MIHRAIRPVVSLLFLGAASALAQAPTPQEVPDYLGTWTLSATIQGNPAELTLEIVDRAYIMHSGKVQAAGSVRELVWNDHVSTLYLGPTLTTRLRQRMEQPA